MQYSAPTTLGIWVIQCRPRDPEAKGLVERANGYLETSFVPGRVFASPADFDDTPSPDHGISDRTLNLLSCADG